jgi:glycosyltransferase involved in cell wall biosynthesis
MSNTPIKLMLCTDSAKIHTGLAETTRLVFKRLLDKYPGKYDIEQLGWFHSPHGPEEVPWQIHPTAVNKGQYVPEDKYGQRSFEGLKNKINPDIVYSNGDLWCFDHILDSPTRNTFRFVAYYTIDGAPYYGNGFEPTKRCEWGSKLAKADEVVVLSEFGRETLINSMPEMKGRDIEVIYHPVDSTRFSPLDGAEKLQRRHQMYGPGIPNDAFVMGWVGRNQYRKQNHKMWELLHYLKHGDYIECLDCSRITKMEYDRPSMKSREVGRLRLYDKDYDYKTCWYCKSTNIVEGSPIGDIYLWSHMNKTDPGWQAHDLCGMWEVRDRVIYTPGLTPAKGIPPQQLADLIATWDCMLYLSGGEGFGIPAYEAMMSGIPVVYSNYSSHADFSQHGGLSVRCEMIPELNFSIHRALADVNHAIERMLWGYRHQDAFKQLGMQGRAWCDTRPLDGVVDQWDGVFTKMMEKPTGTKSTQLVYGHSV